ncbi:ABC transporter ATP-binding protein [archaeon]|jgi:ATP-binding cassette, subfamily B, heavy metal transporter|nr:ABC transporter ATP-binding protein [archaeon]
MVKEEEKKKINYKKNLKEYFSLIGKYKFLIWMIMISVIITEALFIADKFLYKWLIDDAEKFILGSLDISVFVQTILVILAIFLGIVIFRAIGKFMNSYLLSVFEPKIIKDLKEKYFNHILGLSHKFHTTHKTGKLISRLNRGSGAIENLTDIFIFQVAPLILQLIMVSATLFIFAKGSALIMVLISVLFIGVSVWVQKVQNKAKLAWNKAHDKENGFIADVLTNVDTVKYFGKEKRIEKRFDKITSDVKIKSFKFWNYFSYLSLIQTIILGLGVVALLYFPLKQFLAGQIALSTVVFVYSLYGNVVGSLFGFVHGIRGFFRSMADMQDLFEYGDVDNEIKDRKNAKNLIVRKGEIEFKDMDFGYESKKLFNKFNLKIKPNEKVALVGHSGSGKTSLIKLFNRLYDVDGGSILIDGKDLREFKQQSLRSESGIVPQECILFDDTIHNNIKFANPNATKGEVIKAMKQAQLYKIVKEFPQKESTIVGERGVKLSGGEKQRVSIARAILANKKVLVLDEATSALDSRTENDIQKALKKLLKGRTAIIIAHRLSTIMNADRIIVLRKGKIVEQGSHEELIRKKGEYSSLWDLQKGGYIEE